MKDGSKSDGIPRVVVIGGGTGLSVVLRGLKELPLDLTAIVTVADDGGSSGILRSELSIPPPGDVRNVITALADVEPVLSRMLQYRFPSGTGLAGHSVGNLILAAMTDIAGDFVTGIKQLSKVFAVRGRVLPAASQAIVLKAELADGRIITGESNIPKANGKINKVTIDPADVQPLGEAIEALDNADVILIGPGSLFTSIMPNLLIPGMVEAIERSKALKIYVCNVMTQPGETDGYTVSDHVQAIRNHVGCPLFDVVIVNNGEIPQQVLDKYAEKGATAVALDRDAVEQLGLTVIADRLVQYHTYLRHDAERVSRRIYELIDERRDKRR